MSRTFALLAALGLAAPASAATYVGKPAAQPTESRFVGRSIVWTLANAQYQGRTDESRPLILCQSLARRAGRLQSFTVDGRPLADAELERCNAVAPAGSAAPVAEAN